jgi:hypothetical protein
MEKEQIINNLESNINVYDGLCANITTEQSRWKPSSDKWSILEVINHLYDEEQLDFRARVEKLLNNDKDWAPIDPQGWVNSKKYYEREFRSSLDNFIKEREHSVKWLQSLNESGWDTPLEHPKLGTFTAHKMLSAWLAHDYLHIRQIMRILFQYMESVGKNDMIGYAGKW